MPQIIQTLLSVFNAETLNLATLTYFWTASVTGGWGR